MTNEHVGNLKTVSELIKEYLSVFESRGFGTYQTETSPILTIAWTAKKGGDGRSLVGAVKIGWANVSGQKVDKVDPLIQGPTMVAWAGWIDSESDDPKVMGELILDKILGQERKGPFVGMMRLEYFTQASKLMTSLIKDVVAKGPKEISQEPPASQKIAVNWNPEMEWNVEFPKEKYSGVGPLIKDLDKYFSQNGLQRLAWSTKKNYETSEGFEPAFADRDIILHIKGNDGKFVLVTTTMTPDSSGYFRATASKDFKFNPEKGTKEFGDKAARDEAEKENKARADKKYFFKDKKGRDIELTFSGFITQVLEEGLEGNVTKHPHTKKPDYSGFRLPGVAGAVKVFGTPKDVPAGYNPKTGKWKFQEMVEKVLTPPKPKAVVPVSEHSDVKILSGNAGKGKKWRQIIFAQGQDAEEILESLYGQDTEDTHRVAMLNKLMQWDDLEGEGEVWDSAKHGDRAPWGSKDKIYQVGKYVVAYNDNIPYVSLQEELP